VGTGDGKRKPAEMKCASKQRNLEWKCEKTADPSFYLHRAATALARKLCCDGRSGFASLWLVSIGSGAV